MKKTAIPTPKTETAETAPPPAAADAPAASAPELTPGQLQELKTRAAKADEHWDRLLRTAADFENFKKRAARERIEAAQSATPRCCKNCCPSLIILKWRKPPRRPRKSRKAGPPPCRPALR